MPRLVAHSLFTDRSGEDRGLAFHALLAMILALMCSMALQVLDLGVTRYLVQWLVETFPKMCGGDLPLAGTDAATRRVCNLRLGQVGRRSKACRTAPGYVCSDPPLPNWHHPSHHGRSSATFCVALVASQQSEPVRRRLPAAVWCLEGARGACTAVATMWSVCVPDRIAGFVEPSCASTRQSMHLHFACDCLHGSVQVPRQER